MTHTETKRLIWTRRALLTFGAGLLLGLGLIAAGSDALGPLASGLMTLGIAAIPPALLADWRRVARSPRPPARKSAARRAARPATAKARAPRRRPRSPAPPKR